MKTNLIFLMVMALFSCEVEENTPGQIGNEVFDIAGAVLVKEGVLAGIGGHSVSGNTSLLEKGGKYYLLLDPYQSQNGPDLRVYLSRNESATSFVSLGLLKSTMGKQVYTVPAGVDIYEFSHVHIWCQKFSVQFGRALLN
ncbi:MAG TPA: DM13 domain-containing protein [Cyclobacteriaceae bacterium]|nr:DM13 domain-containing protein [Cyclobacteriaceae bacterium]HRJ81811.1 DM13 domain-containing protein [Cyclobacteriaceae bacterium]